MRERWLAIAAITTLSAACNLAQPASSVTPGASIQPVAGACSSIDIRAPSGTRVELSGVWRSNDLGLYHIHQEGSCLYWMGMSQGIGFAPGTGWTNVFVATIHSDLTIVGRWGDVPFSLSAVGESLSDGILTLRIDFDLSGGEEHPILRYIGGATWIGGGTWVLEETLPASTDHQGTFGGRTEEPACVWIESGGERYELVGSAEWRIRLAPVSVQSQDGQIVARIGDPIRVRGRLAATLGSGCTEQAILVEELDPTP